MSRHHLISPLLLVGMLVVYWFLLARGELDEIQTVQAEIHNLRSTLSAREAVVARAEELQGEVDEVARWLEQVQAFYAIEEVTPELLLDVATALRNCGLTPRETTPGPVQASELLTQQSIRIVVQGTLDEVFEFLRVMEESRPLCRVTEMRVEPIKDAGEVRADLTMLRVWREV